MHEDLTPPDVRQQVTQVGDAGSTAWIVADGIGHMIHWQGRVWELPCNRSVDCFWKPHLQSVPLAQHAHTANDGTHKHTLEQSQHAHMWELLLQCSFTRSADCKEPLQRLTEVLPREQHLCGPALGPKQRRSCRDVGQTPLLLRADGLSERMHGKHAERPLHDRLELPIIQHGLKDSDSRCKGGAVPGAWAAPAGRIVEEVGVQLLQVEEPW